MNSSTNYGAPARVNPTEIIPKLMEVVRAVIGDLHSGVIKDFPKVSDMTTFGMLRRTPLFARGSKATEGVPYTTKTVAEYLGYISEGGHSSDSVGAALNALEFIERGTLKESTLKGKTVAEVTALVTFLRKTAPKTRPQPPTQVDPRIRRLLAEVHTAVHNLSIALKAAAQAA